MFKITLNGQSMLEIIKSDMYYERIMYIIENNQEILNSKANMNMSMLEFNLILKDEFGKALIAPVEDIVEKIYLDSSINGDGFYRSLKFDAIKIMLTILNTYNTTGDINSVANTDYLFNRYAMMFYKDEGCCEYPPMHNSIIEKDLVVSPKTGSMSVIEALNAMANIVGIIKTLFIFGSISYVLRNQDSMLTNDS